VQLIADNCKLCILCVYRPPSGEIKVFFDALSELVQYCSKLTSDFILCGDFNIDFLCDTLDKRLLLDFFTCFNINHLSADPTRIFRNKNNVISQTKIDYLVTNLWSKGFKTGTVQANLGDHLAIIGNYKYRANNTDVKNIQSISYRSYSEYNLDMLKSFMENVNFNIYTSLNVNHVYKEIVDTIKWAIEANCPLKNKTLQPNNKKKGWITPQIIKTGNDLKNLFWLTKNLADANVNSLYRQRKKEYNGLIQQAKKDFNSRAISMSQNKQKTAWNIINRDLGKVNTSNSISIQKNNVIISDHEEVANLFLEYFSTITETSLQDKFGNNRSQQCTLPARYTAQSFIFNPVSKKEVINIIGKLKNKNSTGVDGLSVVAIKHIKDFIVEPIQYLAELMFCTGVFPEELKTGLVVPVYKKSDATLECNYRPVTILNILSKILERILHNRIVDFLESCNLVAKCQHGFLSGRSTETAAMALMEFVFKKIDEGEFVAAVFFDLSRAFDTLNIDFVLHKLYIYGFREDISRLLGSYLQNRKMCVKVQNVRSSTADVNIGVPQGSVLGPLLFLLYINEMPEYVQEGIKIMFADDTTVVVSSTSADGLRKKIANVVVQFDRWCASNNLILNIDKTVCLNFCSSGARERIEPESLKCAQVTKFLGLYLDSLINWSFHVDYVCKKINSGFYAIHQLKDTVNQESLVSMYYSFIYSHLSYNTPLWGSSSEWERVFIAQKKAIRCIFGVSYRGSCRPVFVQRKILSFPCIYLYKTLLFIKQNSHEFLKNSDLHNYGTRNRELFITENHNLSKSEKSPVYAGKKFFNKLPNSMKLLEYNKFKLEIKQLLLNKCYYSVNEFLMDSL